MADDENAILDGLLAVPEPDESSRNKFICLVGLSFLASFISCVLLLQFYGAFWSYFSTALSIVALVVGLALLVASAALFALHENLCLQRRHGNPDGQRLVDRFIQFDVSFWDCVGWHDIFDGNNNNPNLHQHHPQQIVYVIIGG
ncbi:hypothetical protein CFC21_070418 [Triticum aestivum]|uniref:Transmembrane protein n=2 Tax=Triticum aestivum TaxID=4565 RepID=A0A9R1HF63_WHEAT|nr:hypothetical protein CFC21_070418 [Triticum aestivum]